MQSKELVLTAEQVRRWTEDPITQLLYEVLKERIDEAKEILVLSDDPDADRRIKGMVVGYEDVLEWQPEVVDAEIQGTESRTPSFD